ncbi:MAG: sigma-70 family RNA polymerase sigma factor [Clostridia bacterium]|nr:sigma-70 family RNA polymerase sigma factor [Clostridia bacterium]
MREVRATDEALALRAQEGDSTAEQELLLRYTKLVRYHARRYFLVGGEAEDLIQEGMIGLFQAIRGYRPKAEGGQNFKNFAHMCVGRQIIDAVKKATSKKNQPLNDYVSVADTETLLSDSDPDEILISAEDRRALEDMMSRVLTDTEFKVFTVYMNGASCAEICEITGKTQKSVDNAVQRSKRKLVQALRRKANDER